MTKKYEMGMMGELTYFLGFKIKQDSKGIFICQERYVRDLLKKYDLTDCALVKCSMLPPNNLGPDESGVSINETLFRGIIWSLMYLTASRPDIQFSTCLYARYQANPKESHLVAVKRIFRRSTSGGFQILGGKLVCWSAKNQSSVAMSSAEADAIAISNNSVLQSRAKHIDIRYLEFGRYLKEIHVTWTHLEKKRTRLRTNTKTLQDLKSRSLEMASPFIHYAVTLHLVKASQHLLTTGFERYDKQPWFCHIQRLKCDAVTADLDSTLSIIYNLPTWLCMNSGFKSQKWMYPFERYTKVIKGHVRNRNRPEGCIAEETIAEETIEFFREYHKTMKTIGIPHDKHVTKENEDEKPLSTDKSSKVSREVFQKAHLYVIQNTYEIVPYIERHKQVLKTKNPSKLIALLENEHSKSLAK
uniref:DUF4218 domain-containing protein n=1 Tax=Tanacetum cinerariifolium TaxID=118510 RepID=A0A6L2L4V6_TANCI|nr:hypothetical protein [Tanacetum cinerariifolium]